MTHRLLFLTLFRNRDKKYWFWKCRTK